MSFRRQVLVFAGSTRAESLNRKLARAAAAAARDLGAGVTHLELGDYPLPIYDGDYEGRYGLPPQVVELRSLLKSHDVWLIASPDYNSSVSPLLKNMIDWVSRPIDEENYTACFKDRTVGIMASSPGTSGGARGLPHLRQILRHLGAAVLDEQFTLPRGPSAFSASGSLVDLTRAQQLQAFIRGALEASNASPRAERIHAA
jgi:chromate reductase